MGEHQLDSDHEDSLREMLPKLRSFALRMVAHPEDAEDVVQEALLKAVKKASTFREESSFETWVFSILTRACLDHLRQRRRYTWDAQEATRTSSAVDHSEVVEALQGEGARFDAREHIAFCFSCVARTLSPEEAAAVLLKEVFGFTNREAAKISGISESVHRHRMAAGRRAMQDTFARLCGLISKSGVCYQCEALQGRSADPRGPIPELPSAPEPSFDLRVAIARGADLEGGVSAELHRVMFRAVRVVGEAPVPSS